MNLSKNVKVTRVLAAVAAGQTNQTGDAVDMSGFEGVLFIASFGTLSSGAVTGIKAQQDTDSAMGTAADLLGTALAIAEDRDGDVLVLDIFRPTERYVRPIVTRGTGNAVIDGVIAIQYGAHKAPTTNDSATVAGTETHISPAEGTA